MYSLACLFHVHTAIDDSKHPTIYNNIASSVEEWGAIENNKNKFLLRGQYNSNFAWTFGSSDWVVCE